MAGLRARLASGPTAEPQRFQAGAHQVRVEFAYDGGGIGKGGLATLFIDGQKVGAGRVEETHPLGFSADETCDVGRESASPVSPDYGPRGNAFSGDVNWVQIDLGLDDQSHLITPEQRLSFAMARQRTIFLQSWFWKSRPSFSVIWSRRLSAG